MNRYNPPRVHLIWLIVAAILMVAIVFKAADASDHYYRDDDNIEVSTDVVTGDNINTGSTHRSLALANALGNVDINDCVISKQISIAVLYARQSYDYNLWCMAGKLDAISKHDEAATLRCRIPDIKKAFPADCEHSMRFEPEIVEPPDLTELYAQSAQHNDDEEERQQVREEQQADIDILMDKFAALERRASRYAAAEREKREYARAELERLKEYRQ